MTAAPAALLLLVLVLSVCAVLVWRGVGGQPDEVSDATLREINARTDHDERAAALEPPPVPTPADTQTERGRLLVFDRPWRQR